MSTKACLGTPTRNTAQRTQDARRAEDAHPHHAFRDHGREAVEDHGDVVEDVRCQPVHFAFWLEGCADSVCEENCCDAP